MNRVDPERRCRNCGEAAGPRFCPQCGQELAARYGPLRQVAHEVLSDWISLDSRLVRSLATLVRPGLLSERYVGGKRAPYLRPFRLYMLASLLLFSTILTLESPDAREYEIYIGGELIGAPASTGKVHRELSLWEEDSYLGRRLVDLRREQIDRLKELPKQEIVDRLFASWRRTLPITLIVFVPFLALGLKILYHPLRRTTRERAVHTLYIDHLIFSFHFQSALFMAGAAVWLLNRIAGIEFPRSALTFVAVLLLMLLAYLPLALRRFYRESWLRTAIKSLAMLFVYSQLLGTTVWVSALAAI